MHTYHAKSPCCRTKVIRFGKRRRQCTTCGHTWRIRKKRRGRASKRPHRTLITAYFNRTIGTVRQLGQETHTTKSSAQRSLARSLAAHVHRGDGAWRTLLPQRGQLILIADAIWYRIGGEKYTIYVLLLRPRTGTEAVIWPPYLAPGHEDLKGWQGALATVPAAIRTRIGALVCDGATGVVSLGYRNRWLLQRCQFHLLAAVQNYLTAGPRSAQQAYAKRVLAEVQTVLGSHRTSTAREALNRLEATRAKSTSRGIRRVLGGLALHWEEYRTYRRHPHWYLPTTSNTAESCIQCIRDLLYRARGFRSATQLILWLTAFTVHKKTIRCRGKYQPN